MNHLVVVLIIGAVAGTLAGLVVRGRNLGLLFSIVLGIAGGWACDHFFGGFFSFTSKPIFNAIIGATVGAIVLSLIINLIFGSRKGGGSGYRS